MPSFDKLRCICGEAVAGQVTPGLAVAVGVSGQTIFCDAFGRRQIEPADEPATADTVYDLASLTKPLVTSVLAMQAVATGRLHLEDSLDSSASAARSAAGPTVAQALAHAGGFVAHCPFYDRLRADERAHPAKARRRIVELAAAEPTVYPPGTRSLYSDLGFILLGDRLEQALGARLDVLAARDLFLPLGLPGLRYADLQAPSPFAGLPVAATQRSASTGQPLVGEVDDGNAHAMGGVAGHAGLFGAAPDVASFVHALCAAWRDSAPSGAGPVVPAAILREFWSPAGIPGSNWRLGWDGPAEHGSLAGDHISRAAVGHLAFTGCSLWIDPQRETFVIVLSNRVHPVAREDPRFRDLRRAVHDSALEGAGYSASRSAT